MKIMEPWRISAENYKIKSEKLQMLHRLNKQQESIAVAKAEKGT